MNGVIGMGMMMICVLATVQIAQAECPPNSEPYKEEGLVVHCRCVKGYVNLEGVCKVDNADNLEKDILNLKKQIARDEKAIRRLGLESRAEDFKEWEQLADEARNQFEEQALESFIDILFTSASDANNAFITKVGSLNTFSSQKLIGKLNKVKIKNERLWKVIREIGATRGKPERAKAAKELIELIEMEGDLLNISREISDNPGNIKTEAEAAATILSWGLKGPLAGWLSSDVQFMFASLYNNATRWESSYNIERLTTLTEQQLKDLSILSGVLKKHVKELQKAKADLENIRKGEVP
jgi:hypothetical protein